MSHVVQTLVDDENGVVYHSTDENDEEVDIFLGEDSSDIIVGPQSANTYDIGQNNEIL